MALVTRNTPHSVSAFFNLIGPEWSGLFSQVLTREFDFVKPDRRLLTHVAKVGRQRRQRHYLQAVDDGHGAVHGGADAMWGVKLIMDQPARGA